MHKYNNEGEKYICKTYLDGSGSYDPDGEVVYWRWGFGDGKVNILDATIVGLEWEKRLPAVNIAGMDMKERIGQI